MLDTATEMSKTRCSLLGSSGSPGYQTGMAMVGGQEGGGGALRKACGEFPEEFLFYKVKRHLGFYHLAFIGKTGEP